METGEIVASGIAILVDDQSVHPLRIELRFDPDEERVVDGALDFGDDSRPSTIYGTSAHGKLVREILASPRRDFRWTHSWHRTDEGWERNEEGQPWPT